MAGHRERESASERLRVNMRILRDRAGMTQPELAAAMREYGHRWHQQTVTRVEAGIQQVKWAEAVSLAAILRTSLDRLTWGSAEASQAEYLYGAGHNARQAAREVSGAVTRLLAARSHAERTAQQAAATGSSRVEAARQDVLDALTGSRLEDAVEDGVAGYETLGDGTAGGR